MTRIVPHLWYTEKAEEAAKFYASVLPNSRVDKITALPADSPSGPAGSVKVVEFTLMGQPFVAFSAGPLDPFNHAVSFMIECDTQEEIDRYWDALLKGGQPEQCGWLKDRYGLSWQISAKNVERSRQGEGEAGRRGDDGDGQNRHCRSEESLRRPLTVEA